MSPWQFESVLDVPRNLPLKFHQNRVSNSWDIADIEFVWRSHGLYGEEPRFIWWGLHSHYIVKPNLVLRLGWGFDNLPYESKLVCFIPHHSDTWYCSCCQKWKLWKRKVLQKEKGVKNDEHLGQSCQWEFSIKNDFRQFILAQESLYSTNRVRGGIII